MPNAKVSTCVVSLTLLFLGIPLVVAKAQPPTPAPAQAALSKSQQQIGQGTGDASQKQDAAGQEDERSQFDQDKAFAHLEAVCEFGPRISAKRGMKKQQQYLEKHFKKIGGKVLNQPFQARSPFDGRPSKLHNLIVQYHPERERRLLICCHYDTRPFADMDPVNPRGKFIGANDGASGVALLCELGRHMSDLEGPYGVDFIFFDGEEYVINRANDPMFLGSTYFAQQYAAGQVPWKYEYGILVDMVADKDLQIYYEGNSLSFDGGDRLSRSIWGVAKQLEIDEFIPEKRHQIRDDHLPLNQIARIPVCDIIDFDYPNPKAGNIYWHTTEDKPENCSAESLGKVGKVVLEWIRQMQELNKNVEQPKKK
ncbi:MAG: M28 family peptidase [Planctomycetota bacterium]